MGTIHRRVGFRDALPISVAEDATARRAQARHAAPTLEAAEVAHIFSRYGVLILRWAERIFHDGATADDVLHEVMLRMLNHGATFLQLPAEAQRRAWLYRTTLRICWSMRSKSKRARERAEEAVALYRDSAPPPAGERHLLDKLSATLEIDERILAVLYFEEGYTKMEIHEMTKRSRPFIDKKLARIASELARLGGEEP
jgi:RNA polymerase sigma factor (sigma-70 family)